VILAFASPAAAAKKPKPPPPVTPAEVVAAERAFAADGLALGVKQSFLKHMADDAMLFQPDPVNAREAVSAQSDAPGPKLQWWPVWAGVSQSNDLGFTTGPYALQDVRRGFYFTMWKRQPDGSWKWIYDGGTASSALGAPGPEREPAYLTMSTQAGRYPEGAFAEAQKAEAALNAAAAEDVVAAYTEALVCEGRIQGSPAPPAQGCASFKNELATRASKIAFTPVGGEASSAGDLAWTYGDAAWELQGQAFRGHYVRVWQSRPEGWRLVFDQIFTSPPKKP
jgi:ketosteroid isomerase-like protein